jgi:hypothetical protein
MQTEPSWRQFVLDQINEVFARLDRLCYKPVRDSMVEIADAKFKSGVAKIGDLHFVNLLLDSAMVFRFSTIPCLLVNSDWKNHLVLVDLYENRGFCTPNSESPFRSVSRRR